MIALTSGNFEVDEKKFPLYFSRMIDNGKDRHYIIQTKDRVIGHIALIRKNTDVFEITIVIGEKDYWGKGFGKEAIRRALKIGFGNLGYKKAYLEVRPENIRAIKVYEACGFIQKGFKKYPRNIHLSITLKMVLDKN